MNRPRNLQIELEINRKVNYKTMTNLICKLGFETSPEKRKQERIDLRRAPTCRTLLIIECDEREVLRERAARETSIPIEIRYPTGRQGRRKGLVQNKDKLVKAFNKIEKRTCKNRTFCLTMCLSYYKIELPHEVIKRIINYSKEHKYVNNVMEIMPKDIYDYSSLVYENNLYKKSLINKYITNHRINTIYLKLSLLHHEIELPLEAINRIVNYSEKNIKKNIILDYLNMITYSKLPIANAYFNIDQNT